MFSWFTAHGILIIMIVYSGPMTIPLQLWVIFPAKLEPLHVSILSSTFSMESEVPTKKVPPSQWSQGHFLGANQFIFSSCSHHFASIFPYNYHFPMFSHIFPMIFLYFPIFSVYFSSKSMFSPGSVALLEANIPCETPGLGGKSGDLPMGLR